eukprot:scaffold6865_cov417-Prasinococcus_capsulatus_cf.AAC.1
MDKYQRRCFGIVPRATTSEELMVDEPDVVAGGEVALGPDRHVHEPHGGLRAPDAMPRAQLKGDLRGWPHARPTIHRASAARAAAPRRAAPRACRQRVPCHSSHKTCAAHAGGPGWRIKRFKRARVFRDRPPPIIRLPRPRPAKAGAAAAVVRATTYPPAGAAWTVCKCAGLAPARAQRTAASGGAPGRESHALPMTGDDEPRKCPPRQRRNCVALGRPAAMGAHRQARRSSETHDDAPTPPPRGRSRPCRWGAGRSTAAL